MDVQLELSQRKVTRMIRTALMHVLSQSFLSPDEPTGYARCFDATQTLYLTLQLAKPDGGAMLSLYLSFSFTCQVKTYTCWSPSTNVREGKQPSVDYFLSK